jgi:hypothetical protein
MDGLEIIDLYEMFGPNPKISISGMIWERYLKSIKK